MTAKIIRWTLKRKLFEIFWFAASDLFQFDILQTTEHFPAPKFDFRSDVFRMLLRLRSTCQLEHSHRGQDGCSHVDEKGTELHVSYKYNFQEIIWHFTVWKVQEFDWNSKGESLLLSSFFYGYISTQYLGGWLALKVGGANSFAGGILCASVHPNSRGAPP